nr:hypothetical protein [Candidatus Sigynarchaeota archaeon]
MSEIEINCPNCKAALPVELRRDLQSGKAVTCENCGIVLVPKAQGQASSPITASKPAGHKVKSPGIPRGPGTAPLVGIKVPSKATASPAGDKCCGRVPGTSPTGGEKPAVPVPVPGSPEYIAETKKQLAVFKGKIHDYNELSLNLMKIFLSLFFVISLSMVTYRALFGQVYIDFGYLVTTLLFLLPQYIMGAFMYWYETRRLHKWIAAGQYEFYGIDIVIAGLAGLYVYGIGILLVIKGFAVMAYMTKQDRIFPKPRRDALIAWINGFDEISWMVASIAAASAFCYMVWGLMTGIVSMTIPSPELVGFIIMGICGTIAANGDLRNVSAYVREWKFDGIGGKAMGYAVIGCICMGSGTPMIVKAIMLLVLEAYDKEHGVPERPLVQKPERIQLPRHETPAVPPITPLQPAPTAGPVPPVQPVKPAEPIPAKPAQAPALPPLAPATLAKQRAKKPATLPRKAETSVEAFLQRNFNVLTPRVRKRLIKLSKLGLSDDEIEAIAEELVYHPEFEQLDIIDEYIELNKAEEIDPMHVLAVRNMTYDENTKKWILDQLKTLPDKEIPAFIDQMKKSQPN